MTERIEGGEFIERERQHPPEETAGNVAQGSTAESQRALVDAQLGAPPADYDVRSVYDSRPINGYDFNITAISPGGEIGTATLTVSFTVRQGFVAVLRRLSHFFTGALPAIVERSEALLTLTRNGADVLDNIDVPVGLFSDDLWQGFIIADENETLGARIELQGGLVADELQIQFYGNYLLKTGRASNLEIANPIGGRGCAPAPVMLAPTRPAPASVVIREVIREPAPARVIMAPAPPRVKPQTQVKVLHSGGTSKKRT